MDTVIFFLSDRSGNGPQTEHDFPHCDVGSDPRADLFEDLGPFPKWIDDKIINFDYNIFVPKEAR